MKHSISKEYQYLITLSTEELVQHIVDSQRLLSYLYAQLNQVSTWKEEQVITRQSAECSALDQSCKLILAERFGSQPLAQPKTTVPSLQSLSDRKHRVEQIRL